MVSTLFLLSVLHSTTGNKTFTGSTHKQQQHVLSVEFPGGTLTLLLGLYTGTDLSMSTRSTLAVLDVTNFCGVNGLGKHNTSLKFSLRVFSRLPVQVGNSNTDDVHVHPL